ncbi:MAG: hypothetical protein DI570_06875 [Phenylobacterium zucineum]|nr:MAG: hypothetical protein DI570_06875 [Phenylobacterium zucineum]
MSIKIAKAGAAALAGMLALTSVTPAFAQSGGYGPYTAQDRSGYHYDPCKRDQTNRGTAGALIGGGMGAVIGSNAAARNARTEGALLGGLLGAVMGGMVGNKSAACTSQQPYYNTTSEALPPPPPPRADSSYYDRDAYADSRDSAWREDDRYRVAERPRDTAEDCTLAESPIHMPDGRTQTRFVRVCRDATGKYAVVD